MKIKITFNEPLLGTKTGNLEIYKDFMLEKTLVDVPKDEASAIKTAVKSMPDEELEKVSTIFPRNEQGQPVLWDYQIKGFFKDAQSMFNRVKDKDHPELKAYKKEIDGLIFVSPRLIAIDTLDRDTEWVERPLRASTAQGERIALARSESVPAGSRIEFEVTCLKSSLENYVYAWLDYGALRGLGQWRNSGMGRFGWQEL